MKSEGFEDGNFVGCAVEQGGGVEFASVAVGAAEGVEVCGILTEEGVVVADAVAGVDGLGESVFEGAGGELHEGVFGRGEQRSGVPVMHDVKVLTEGVMDLAGAVDFAFDGVSGDMGGGEIGGGEEVPGEAGFGIPDVEDQPGEVSGGAGPEEGGVFGDFAAAGVDEGRPGFDPREFSFAEEGAGGPGAVFDEGDVEGDDIGGSEKVRQIGPGPGFAAVCFGRVVAEDGHAQGVGFGLHAGADLSASDDAEGFAGKGEAGGGTGLEEGGDDIFGHGVGVAAGCGGEMHAEGGEAFGVGVVDTGGAGSGEAEAGAAREFRDEPGFAAGDDGVHSAHGIGGDVVFGQEGEVSERAEGRFAERDAGCAK